MPRLKRSEKEEILLEQVTKDYLCAREYRSKFEPDWLRYYRMYRSKLPTDSHGGQDPYPFESEVFIPYVYSIIETQLPLLIQQTFGGNRFLEVSGQKINDELNADIVREILNFQFDRDIRIFDLIYLWAKQCLIYGTSPIFADWKYELRKIRVRVPSFNVLGEVIGEEVKKVERVIKNGPSSGVIDLFRYFQCPTTTGNPAEDETVLYGGWEFYTTIEELHTMKRSGFLNGSLDALKEQVAEVSHPYPQLEDRLRLLDKSSQDQTHYQRGQISCIRYFGHVKDSGASSETIYRDMIIAYAGGLPSGGTGTHEGIFLRNEENPFFHDRIPVCLLRVNHNVDELYGVGDAEISESLQIELNDQRNQRNDLIVREMDKMFKVKRGKDYDEAQLTFRPFGVVEVDEMEDIQPLLQGPSTLGNSFVEESNIKQDIQFATGISDFVVGQFQNSSGFNDTATGISLIQAAAENRIVLKGQFLQVGIKCLGELIWKLNQQYLDYNTIFKVLDPNAASRYKFVQANPSVIAGDYNFTIVNGSAAGNPQIRRQQMIQIMQVLAQLTPAAAQAGQQINVDYTMLMKRMLEEFNIPNIAQIFPGLADRQLTINDIPDDYLAEQGGEPSIDPETENGMIISENAVDLPVSFSDNDLEHIVVHRSIDYASASQTTEMNKHIQLHMNQLSKKKEMMVQSLQADAQALSMGIEPGPDDSGQVVPKDLPQTGDSSPTSAGGQENVVRTAANNISL